MKQANNGVFKYALTNILISGLLGVGLGLFLILVNISFLMGIIFIIIGILTVFNNLPSLIFSFFDFKTNEGKIMLVLSFFATAIGVAMIFFHNWILMIVLGIYFIFIPLLRLLLSQRHQELVGEELPKMILGVVMLLLGPASMMSILFRVAGIAVIALSAVYMVGASVALSRAQVQTGNRVFVDETGDGKVDTVYVDTDGDGEVDSATRYRDDK
jgi:hypothetical protein